MTKFVVAPRVQRLAAIFLIFTGASVAWTILGTTLVQRTDTSDATQRADLDGQWGAPVAQMAPTVNAFVARLPSAEQKRRGQLPYDSVAVPLRSSRMKIRLDLEQRRKGLLWYNLYTARFDARYVVANTTGSRTLEATFGFPRSGGNFTDFRYSVNGKPLSTPPAQSVARYPFVLAPGKQATIDIGYTTRGTDVWTYEFGTDVTAVRDFTLAMTTNFRDIDFPHMALLPTRESQTAAGWDLEWHYNTIVTSNSLGIAMPKPLQPGPLAQRITFWAPVALAFYFFVIVVITTLRNVDLHPYNYFFLACAFFAFHLLFAYLVDRIAIEAAFAVCSAVTLFLTVSYLRLVAGMRFAAVESGLAQLVYLVLFSYALFNEGWSGLAITIGAILTLFTVMQLTGRIRWSQQPYSP